LKGGLWHHARKKHVVFDLEAERGVRPLEMFRLGYLKGASHDTF